MSLASRASLGGTKVAHPSFRQCPSSRGALVVVANKKGVKRTKVVLTANVTNVGQAGELVSVQNGYMTNYLLPQRLAKPATEQILADIQAKIDEEERKKAEVVAKAKAMAQALKTIGTIKIPKKVGEAGQIFGSVQPSEITDYIKKQTGRELDSSKVTLPEMKSLGTYEASIKLHAQVTGFFKVQVVKQPN